MVSGISGNPGVHIKPNKVRIIYANTHTNTQRAFYSLPLVFPSYTLT